MVSDGQGTMAWAQIQSASPKEVVLSVETTENDYQKRGYSVWIALAPTKNIDRYEWFLEKATEVGIDRITPLLCERSIRRVLKHERGEKIVVGAAKQSLKAYLPQVDELLGFKDFIVRVALEAKAQGKKLYIAHCEDERSKVELKDKLNSCDESLILIGPEGDFSPDEVALAHGAGFQSVSLGTTRLRTETAALYAVMAAAIKA